MQHESPWSTAIMATIGSASAIATSTSVALLLILATLPRVLGALELDSCDSPLGMESGAIKNSSITASSVYDFSSVGPQHGRLRNNKNGGAWCPRNIISREAKEYLEIDLEKLHVITETRTQGRYGNGQGREYAEEYMVDYWRPGLVEWKRWKNRSGRELLKGNSNTNTIMEQKLDPPIIASKIRFLPYSEHVRTVCMRVEVVGCPWKDGILSYSMPQGTRKGKLDLRDETYDGLEDAGHVFQGLGQLVDGHVGQDNFRVDLTGYGKGYEWIGWRNDSIGSASGQSVEILFEFDVVRNFSAVHLHTNNLFSMDVQVFSHAKVFFSVENNVFDGEAVHFSYMPDLVLEHARNVTIKLHHRIGKWVKLQLYFASRWILLSEVSFDSKPATNNSTEQPENGANQTSLHNSKEYPPQRDEGKRLHTRYHSNNTTTFSEPKFNEGTGFQYIAFVIGTVIVAMMILLAAIGFIIFRNYRLKETSSVSRPPVVEDKPIGNEKMRLETNDKTSLFPTTFRPSFYSKKHNSGDFTDVPDLVCREFPPQASPQRHTTPSKKKRSSRPSLNFLADQLDDALPEYETVGSIASSPLNTLSRHQQPGGYEVLKQKQLVKLPPTPKDLWDTNLSEIESFPRDQLRIVEKFGVSQFCDIHLCEIVGSYRDVGWHRGDTKFVVVHTLRAECYRTDFNAEVNVLSRLRHANIARLLGACLDSEPICAIREYTPHGDLCQFLQDHVAETAKSPTSTARTLSLSCLIYMATQIAAGMKYLESQRFVHKDLAARNCLVGKRYEIKISDFGSCRQIYSSDYCQIAGSLLPLRWMAWESVISGHFSSKSDVWSFGITLWEILTFAREQPFEELSNDEVMENVTRYYEDEDKPVLLGVPVNCPKDIYELMCECWQRNDVDRPKFREINLFLQKKILGYNPDFH
ncbi:discoidin domain-containing receptor 2-like isoform X2 [Coccinella septempunctata]|nr:discoidin domain-containing receptor 2-like isoform X2 [Coccinella septempunctata]XP_044758974.1 discoidin domain-containing receptor 2-like isoform X2 [Coccinella septempunctata]